MPLERGAVYLVPTLVRERSGATGQRTADKYQVVLQDPRSIDPNSRNYAYVLASTARSPEPRLFEVELGGEDGFQSRTIVDGRWVYTGSREALTHERYVATLSAERMNEISLAIICGLHLSL